MFAICFRRALCLVAIVVFIADGATGLRAAPFAEAAEVGRFESPIAKLIWMFLGSVISCSIYFGIKKIIDNRSQLRRDQLEGSWDKLEGSWVGEPEALVVDVSKASRKTWLLMLEKQAFDMRVKCLRQEKGEADGELWCRSNGCHVGDWKLTTATTMPNWLHLKLTFKNGDSREGDLRRAD